MCNWTRGKATPNQEQLNKLLKITCRQVSGTFWINSDYWFLFIKFWFWFCCLIARILIALIVMSLHPLENRKILNCNCIKRSKSFQKQVSSMCWSIGRHFKGDIPLLLGWQDTFWLSQSPLLLLNQPLALEEEYKMHIEAPWSQVQLKVWFA